MEFVLVLVGVAVLAGLAVWALRHRGSDEMHSVAGYQQRLERLEELRRRQSGSVRVIGSTGPQGDADQQPVVGEHGRIEISSSPSRRRAVEETGQHGREPGAGPAPPPTYRRRSRDTSIARMGHRPRRLGAPIAAAVAVIILVTGLAIAGAHSRNPHTTTSTTIGKVHKGKVAPTTTTTTVPPTFAPSSASGTDATYTLPFPSYTVSFKATTGQCYIQVTNSAGQTPYAAVLNPGQTKQIVLTGTSKVQLGAPSSVTIQIDKTPVTFPNPIPAPLNITFAGVTPPTSTSTTSTPPTT
jgi:hypothetical protein